MPAAAPPLLRAVLLQLLPPPPPRAPLGLAEGVEERGLDPSEGAQHAAEPRVHVRLQDRADLWRDAAGARAEQRLHVE